MATTTPERFTDHSGFKALTDRGVQVQESTSGDTTQFTVSGSDEDNRNAMKGLIATFYPGAAVAVAANLPQEVVQTGQPVAETVQITDAGQEPQTGKRSSKNNS